MVQHDRGAGCPCRRSHWQQDCWLHATGQGATLRLDLAACRGGLVLGAVMAPAFDFWPFMVPVVLMVACLAALLWIDRP